MTVFTDKNLERNLFARKTVAIIGYGNQGHAHALNLRDSGARVIVGARPGGGAWEWASRDGFDPGSIIDVAARADCVAVLLPDEAQEKVCAEEIFPFLRPEAALVFAHGFAVAFGVVKPSPDHDVLLVAPKAQGHYVRAAYEKGGGVACLVGVENDASGLAWQKALSYAQMLGCLRAGAIKSSFRDEAVTDLFGEQVSLCGGVPGLVKAAYETLVDRGYPPAVAYNECLHELKIITDLMVEGGVGHMRQRISRTAAWGSFLAEDELITDDTKKRMAAILDRIESGEFAEDWRREASAGGPLLNERIETEKEHSIEAAGDAARKILNPREEEE
jgi:ketol-acid reductoisomerase